MNYSCNTFAKFYIFKFHTLTKFCDPHHDQFNHDSRNLATSPRACCFQSNKQGTAITKQIPPGVFPTHRPLHTSRHLRNQRSFYMLNTLQETNISHQTGKGTSSTQKCRLGRGYVSSLEGSFFDQVSFR